MSGTERVPVRIKELAKKLDQDDAEISPEILLEIYNLRQGILQSAGDGMNDVTLERLHKLVLMMGLLDDLVRDKLNIDRMRRLEREYQRGSSR